MLEIQHIHELYLYGEGLHLWCHARGGYCINQALVVQQFGDAIDVLCAMCSQWYHMDVKLGLIHKQSTTKSMLLKCGATEEC